jgi:hypothetical protein
MFNTNKKCFFMFIALKLQKWIVLVLNVIFPTKCAPFFLKIGKDFDIDDLNGKRTLTNDFF